MIKFISGEFYLQKYQYKYQKNNKYCKLPFPTKFKIKSGAFLDLSNLVGEEKKQDFIKDAYECFKKELEDWIIIHEKGVINGEQLDGIYFCKN